jgi:hypothetical protein
MKEGIFIGPQITQLFGDQAMSKKFKFYRTKRLEGIRKRLQKPFHAMKKRKITVKLGRS